MFGESSNLPIGGGILLSAVIYGALSVFVTGPVVAERTIDRGGWQAQCQADLKNRLVREDSERRLSQPVIPQLDCNLLLGMFGASGQDVCRHFETFGGNPSFRLPGMDQLEAQQRQMREARQRRLEASVKSAGSRCTCAASLTMENRRIPFAIYAGSARLITPAPVKNLQSELEASLRSPLCAAKD